MPMFTSTRQADRKEQVLSRSKARMTPAVPFSSSTATIGKAEPSKFAKTDTPILAAFREASAAVEVGFKVDTGVVAAPAPAVTECEEDLAAVVASVVVMEEQEATRAAEVVIKVATAVVAVSLAALLLRQPLRIHSLISPQPAESVVRSSLSATYVSHSCQETHTNENSYHGQQATTT